MTGKRHVLGIYTKKGDAHSGSGSTQRVDEQTTYWYVVQVDDDAFEVQPLNDKNIPSGVVASVAKKDFLQLYHPEPGYYEQKTLPFLKSLQEKLERGEEAFREGLLDEAEALFSKAILLDDKNVKANMGLGCVYSSKGNRAKLKKILDILMNSDETFQEEQRQQFNLFGITLRKDGHLDDAVRYYGKALEADEGDEHLHFNIARAYCQRGDAESCKEHLERALELDADFGPAKKFLAYVDKHGCGDG